MSVYKRDRSGHTIPRGAESRTRGTWYFEFMIRGRTYRESIPEARTRGQAERAEIAAKEDAYNDRYGLRRSPLFADFLDSIYLPWAEANKRSFKRADKSYAGPLRAFFGRYKLAEITPLIVEKYKKIRRETPTIHETQRKPASVNREIECLSRIFSLAFDSGEIAANPCRKVRKLRADNRRTRYLSREEEEVLDVALAPAPDYLRALVALAIQTGMRRGELLKLRWEDVDFSRGTIYIRAIKDPEKSRDREIPMSGQARAILAGRPRNNERVFPLSDFKKSWQSAVKRSGLKNLHFHDLRHTAATRWGEAGATAKEISELLGVSILVGERYVHAIRARMRNVVDDANQPQATIHELKSGKK